MCRRKVGYELASSRRFLAPPKSRATRVVLVAAIARATADVSFETRYFTTQKGLVLRHRSCGGEIPVGRGRRKKKHPV